MGSPDQDLIHGKVAELGAFEGGDRLKATLMPEDEGPPIRLDLKSPPPELAEAIVLGARVGCRAYLRPSIRGPIRIAFWIDTVERREGFDQWVCVWTAPKPFVPRRREVPDSPPPDTIEQARVAGGAIRRRRVAGVEADAGPASARPRAPVDTEEGELVSGVLRRLERLANMRTLGTVLPDDGGPLVELRLRRAPRGLLTALATGARIHCLAAPHMSDPSLRFSARVVSVDLKDSEGRYQEAWRHDPTRERRVPYGSDDAYDDDASDARRGNGRSGGGPRWQDDDEGGDDAPHESRIRPEAR